AKKLLYVSTKTTKKLVSRRKNKKQKDVEDMITVFKTIPSEQIPLFVAYDLCKLPPVCFDHVDVTKLLKDILILRQEIANIKCNYATNEQLENVRAKINTDKSSHLTNSNVNKKRGGYLLDSGPFGLPHISQQLSDDDEPQPPPPLRPEVTHPCDDSTSDSPPPPLVPTYRPLVHTHTGGE
ncbi:hypothetical protein JYU34_022492, partial [Plutella xylostella]